jgi:hypothetical protein
MATTAVPVLQVQPSPPKRGGLLANANVVDVPIPRFAIAPEVDEWPCTIPHRAPGLCWDPDAPTGVKEFDGLNHADAYVFALYSGVECYLDANDEYEERARFVLEQGESAAIEQAIQEMLPAPEVGAPVAGSVTEAIAWAEQRASVFPGTPTILMSRFIATHAIQARSVFPGLDWTLTTGQGTPVVNGAFDSADTLWWGGQATVFRGPIEVFHAPNQTVNLDRVIAERIYAVHFNCGLQAIQMEPIPASCCGGGGSGVASTYGDGG